MSPARKDPSEVAGSAPQPGPAKLVLVCGVSGAGKSVAVDALSDLGFFTVENLPVALFSNFLEFLRRSPHQVSRAALSPDIDSRLKQEQFLSILKGLESHEQVPHLLFLDCKTEVIVKRYGQTRRPHPGFNPEKDLTLEDAIARERQRMFALREVASLAIDTSDMNVHDLRREVREWAAAISPSTARCMRVNFLSFGFRHGLPIDCDLVVDVRFLPNPYFVEEMRNGTGLDEAVREYVLRAPACGPFIEKYVDLLLLLLAEYRRDGRSYLNIGIGCTGGRHRSVAIAERFASELRPIFPSTDYLIGVKHRDLEKPH